LNTRGSSENSSFLFGMVCRDTILLSQGHTNQLTKGISLHKVQVFLELSVQGPDENDLASWCHCQRDNPRTGTSN
jgi:hypothetical protein